MPLSTIFQLYRLADLIGPWIEYMCNGIARIIILAPIEMTK